MENTASIAVIMGGGRGMGRDAALRLAQRGVSSIITYHSRRDEADKVVSAIQKAGAQATALQLDVGKAASFMNFADRVRAALAQMGAERFDYLVTNAGGSSAASLADGTEAEMDARFAVHFKGPFPLTQTPPPLMNDGGRIVHISSGLTRLTFPGRAIHGPTSAAVSPATTRRSTRRWHHAPLLVALAVPKTSVRSSQASCRMILVGSTVSGSRLRAA